MTFGLKQDENQKLYFQTLVNTDGGRQAGMLVREEYRTTLPPFYFMQTPMHKWKIHSQGREAEVLTQCSLANHPQEGLRCKICKHLTEKPVEIDFIAGDPQ